MTRTFAPPLDLITVESLLAREPPPCLPKYPESRLRELFGDGKTALEVCNLDILVLDRLWVLLHPDAIGERLCHVVACDYAESAMALVSNPDPRSVNAPAVKRRWMAGKATDEGLAAAEAGAQSVDRSAWSAGSAARSGARSAAWSARLAWSAARLAGSTVVESVQLETIRQHLLVHKLPCNCPPPQKAQHDPGHSCIPQTNESHSR